MKISQGPNPRSTGFTIIEVTLVIAVLLAFIGVLFIGAASYKEGTNRAKCILTVSMVQKAVRSYQNLNELDPGDVLEYRNLVGENKLIEIISPCGSQELTIPESGFADGFAALGYNALGKIPESGIPFISCKTTGLEHAPSTDSGW